MFVQLVLAEVTANKTTERGIFNNRDEVYFAIAGSDVQGKIENPRIAPPSPNN